MYSTGFNTTETLGSADAVVGGFKTRELILQ